MSAAAISAPTRTGRSALRSVMTMKTPLQTSLANLLAFGVNYTGDERFTLQFKDLRTGEILADRIEDVFYGGAWSADTHASGSGSCGGAAVVRTSPSTDARSPYVASTRTRSTSPPLPSSCSSVA